MDLKPAEQQALTGLKTAYRGVSHGTQAAFHAFLVGELPWAARNPGIAQGLSALIGGFLVWAFLGFR